MPGQLDSLPPTTRCDVVAPGVAPVFFHADAQAPDPDVPARFGLVPGRYLIATSRMAESKNLAGTVALLGELRALSRDSAGPIRLAVVGGTLEPREPEELAVERSIRAAMAAHSLTDGDVVRIPSQPWPVLAQLLRQSLFYVAMQRFEPFGMGAAEALAAGAPVLLSEQAGIAHVLEASQAPGEPCALLVDPRDPRDAARRLQGALDAPVELERMREAGRRLARQTFSWPYSALRLASRLDGLVALDARPPRRRAAGHHRLTAAWRGDRPRVAPHHLRAAEELVPWLLDAERAASRSGGRLIAAIGGESGAGKTEIAHCLRLALRRHGLASALLPGDIFFRLPPSANHQARMFAHRAGRLDQHIGPPGEVDLASLDHVLAAAADPRTVEVHCPSDCRALPGRRYARVPLDLSGCRIVLVDLTYAMLLDSPALRIFLASGYRERMESTRERNRERDPDQDLALVREVLAIEHRRIAATARRAHLTVDRDGHVRESRSPERTALAPTA
jgi:uridine kinase